MEDRSDANAEYLSRALVWLRLRLQQLDESGAGPVAAAPPPPVAAETALLDTSRRRWRRPPAPLPPPPAPPGPSQLALPRHRVTDEEVGAAHESMEEVARSAQPALLDLSERLGLSPFERHVVLLCAAMELDPGMAGLCAGPQGDSRLAFPTFALAFRLFPEPAWEAISPHRALRFWRIVEISQPPGQPLTSSVLRIDERILNYVKGLNELDDRLEMLMPPMDGTVKGALAPSQQQVVDAIVGRFDTFKDQGAPPAVELLGADVASKHLVAAHAAARLRCRLRRLPAELLPTQPGELEGLARLWHRESILLPLALYVDAEDVAGAGGSDAQVSALTRFLTNSDGVFFVGTRERWPVSGRTTLEVDVARPLPAEQRAAWVEVLGPARSGMAASLAGQFRLDRRTIEQIAEEVLAGTPADSPQLEERLWSASLATTRPRMDALAQRLDPKATWDDIVLPPPELALLHQIADQVGQRTKVYEEWGFGDRMNRGMGISALFTGSSGTGKTMAAEVIANALRLNLYRIDLSAVVSKYIGETEKNLRRLFDAAEEGGALLFFDEADALFGKRSEVKDSHDRYANIEINYLLQRMESYSGIAILASNMKKSLDQAFLRRLRFIVNFPFPAVEQRREIWARAFPSRTPTGPLDHARLARLQATGGMIHNIALNAAFVAARTGSDVTMPIVLDVARTEFRKLEVPLVETDFLWTPPPATAAPPSPSPAPTTGPA